MIINFSNLGGGGGGGYVLPIASDTRLGGVKIGSGITIDASGAISADGSSYTAGDYIEISDGAISVTGVTSRADFEEASEVISTALNDLQDNKADFDDLATKQTYFSAATVTDMNAIQNPKVGDICLKVENFTAVDMDAFYNSAGQGVTFGSALESCGHSFGSYDAVKFTPIDNPNVGSSPTSNYPGNVSFYQFYWVNDHSEQVTLMTNGDGSVVQYLKEPSYYQFNTAPVVISGLKGNGSGGGGTGDWYKLFLSTANTEYSKVLTIAVGEAAATYQFREDNAWHLITEDADAAMQKARQAENTANQKVSANGIYVNSWSDLQYQSTCVGVVSINNVNQGYRIHAYGANTEYTNPRVDQIVTSDSFLRVKKLTQQAYDDLTTYDPLVCYIIVENQ